MATFSLYLFTEICLAVRVGGSKHLSAIVGDVAAIIRVTKYSGPLSANVLSEVQISPG
jgi:hypothetical protein